MTLTKSKYINALQCHKRLWQEEFAEDLAAPMGRAQQRILDQGTYLGELARKRFPAGRLVRSFGAKAEEVTQDLLQSDVPAIFEAAFVYDDVLVRCDILERNRDGSWNIIEVKGSTAVKSSHLPDLAVQRYVVEGCGLTIDRLFLMHVDKENCVYPELDALFALDDVTWRVNDELAAVPAHLRKIRAMLAQPTVPEVAVGGHCKNPNPCPFQAGCWQDIPSTSIHLIPRLRSATKAKLIADGIEEISALPTDMKLSTAQQRHVDCMLRNQEIIDTAGVATMLESLVYPLYFFDFETDAPAVPLFEGMRPFQQTPFQYSCHVLFEDGTLEHREYLHTEATDPRRALTDALLRDLDSSGSVIVYNAQFERKVLHDLALAFPADAAALHAVAARLWDQLDIFRKHYASPRFGGSNSIKSVLPALVPELTYKDLAIQKGDDAQAAWAEMLATTDKDASRQLADALRAYCERDTIAMVEIHNKLSETVQVSLPV